MEFETLLVMANAEAAHTADLHLGWKFSQLDADDLRKLARARLAVVEQIWPLPSIMQLMPCCGQGYLDTPNPRRTGGRVSPRH